MESQGSVVKHPRYYFFDPGVLNGLLGSFAASSDRVGALFEHLIVSQLGATASAYDRDLALYTFLAVVSRWTLSPVSIKPSGPLRPRPLNA